MCAKSKARIFQHKNLELSFQLMPVSSDRETERLSG